LAASASAFAFSFFFRSRACRFSFFRFLLAEFSHPGEWHIDETSESSLLSSSWGTISPSDLMMYFVVVALKETFAGGIARDKAGVVIALPVTFSVEGCNSRCRC
jgi:hypothetical protein